MIVIRRPETRDDYRAYYTLRYRVLREPWGQARGTEKDDYEPLSQHLMAVDDEDDEVVGVIKWMEKDSGVACRTWRLPLNTRRRALANCW